MTSLKRFFPALCALLCFAALALSGCSAVSAQYNLNLPDTYSIEYTITDEYEGYRSSYSQAITKAENGYYLELGSGRVSAERRYIFERQPDGKYLQYTSIGQGEYSNALSTEVNEALVASMASPITTNFTYYTAYAPYMLDAGKESVAGVDCDHYTASVREFWGVNEAEFWVSPETGLCMKLKYLYQSPGGAVGTRTIECVRWQTGNVALPAHG